MTLRSGFLGCALAAALLAPVGGQRAEATLVVNFANALLSNTGVDLTAGFSFTTTSALEVTSLAYFFPQGAGGAVRIFDQTGMTLASTVVLATDPTVATGNVTYNVRALNAPLSLAANALYYIVGDVPRSLTLSVLPRSASGVTIAPGVTYGSAVAGIGYGNPTTDFSFGNLNPGAFNVNFEATPVIAVPEASPWIVWTVGGLIGVIATAWRRVA